MRLARTPAEVREALALYRDGAAVGLVPTMGALHEGHRSLLRAARERCDAVAMSLFVNPAQFRPGEDLAGYPRDEQRDARIAEAEGVDVLYAPAAGDVYPAGFATTVEVTGRLTGILEADPEGRGAEHFRGVTTIVAKLLNTVRPSFAFFGQKDWQQALVVRRMVEDLDFGVEVVVMPTVREPDGLAMSSRNAYLDPGSRRRAAAIGEALRAIEAAAATGETSTEAALAAGRAVLGRAGIEPEYLEAREPDTLAPEKSFNGRPVLVAVAARVGGARLIDNVIVGGGARAPSGRGRR